MVDPFEDVFKSYPDCGTGVYPAYRCVKHSEGLPLVVIQLKNPGVYDANLCHWPLI